MHLIHTRLPQFLCFSFLTLVTLLWSTATASAEDKKIGVAVSAVINMSPSAGTTVSRNLGLAIQESIAVQSVVYGRESQALLPRSARDESCLGDTVCLIAAGRALMVDQLLMLIIVDIGENYKVEATWVDVSTGQTALRPPLDIPKEASLMSRSFQANIKTLLPNAQPRQVEVAPPKDIHVTPPPQEIPGNTNTSYTQTPTITPTLSKRHWTPTSKLLFYGGLVGTTLAISYGGYRYLDCKGSKTGEKCSTNEGADKFVDVVGFTSGAVAATGLLLYYFSEDKEKAPVALDLTSTSAGLTYQGAF